MFIGFFLNGKSYSFKDDIKDKFRLNGDVCYVFINGDVDEFKIEIDKLFCEDGEIEIVL